ncbi:MAG TPA: serine/threonine-protein kinase [Ilumatobacteraceae bacterium]|nr:serine/threonine-protein kinase [Ilumatobacteraceae bacterium]
MSDPRAGEQLTPPGTVATLPPPELTAGRVLGNRYRLDHRIGIGGVGEVWEAKDSVLGRTVAVKAVASHVPHDQFEREARMAASISHPNVATVHDFGVDEGTPYLVMERAKGTPLSTLVHGSPVPLTLAIPVLTQVAEALDDAHEAGVIHRDVKPGNIVVDAANPERPRVKLTDFGIAATRADRMRDRSGTPHYMAPEQVTGKGAEPASDVYSLGVVAFELLTGRRPFDGSSPEEIANARLDTTPPSLPETVPLPLRSLVRSAMDVDPRRRPSAATFARRARSVAPAKRVTVAATATRVDGPLTRTQIYPAAHRQRRGWWWLAAGVVSLLLVVGILAASQSGPLVPEPPNTILPTTPVTTAAPPTTVAPEGNDNSGPGNNNGNGNGNGKGKGKGDD